MSYTLVKNIVDKSMYPIKCPYPMTATRIVVHNTANDASARNEIAYMRRNSNYVSFHYAVDDIEVVQGIYESRNAWHAGDGNGKGNREGIGIEICYSKSGGTRFTKAENNAIDFIVTILKRKGWGVDRVTKHQDYSGKYCPHRTLDKGWTRFINEIDKRLKGQTMEYIKYIKYQDYKDDLKFIFGEYPSWTWTNWQAKYKNWRARNFLRQVAQTQYKGKLIRTQERDDARNQVKILEAQVAELQKANGDLEKEVGQLTNDLEYIKSQLADCQQDRDGIIDKIVAFIKSLLAKITKKG